MRGETLELIYSFDSVSPSEVWACTLKLLRAIGRCPETFKISGSSHRVDDIAGIVARRGSRYFNVEAPSWRIRYSHVKNFDHSFVEVESCEPVGIRSWQQSKRYFFNDDFISGRVMDAEYDHWQNATDPLQFEAARRSHDKLPHVSNGLPYPLEKRIIDISDNPGRRVIRDGFVEAVGAVMWLGPIFFKRTHCDAAVLQQLLAGHVIDLADGIVEVTMQDRCFTHSDGEERERQLTLRRALFSEI